MTPLTRAYRSSYHHALCVELRCASELNNARDWTAAIVATALVLGLFMVVGAVG